MSTPVPAMITRPTKTFDVWNVAPAVAIIRPIPAWAAISSATTTLVGAGVTAEQHAQRQPTHDRQDEAEGELLAADRQVVPDLPFHDIRAEGDDDIGRTRQKQLGHEPAEGDELPHSHKSDDRAPTD